MPNMMRVKLYPIHERIANRFFSGNSLRSPARFANRPPPEEIGSWTFLIEFKKVSETGDFFWGTGGFAVDDAPHHLLQQGATLEFLEGPIPVIRIEIISSED